MYIIARTENYSYSAACRVVDDAPEAAKEHAIKLLRERVAREVVMNKWENEQSDGYKEHEVEKWLNRCKKCGSCEWPQTFSRVERKVRWIWLYRYVTNELVDYHRCMQCGNEKKATRGLHFSDLPKQNQDYWMRTPPENYFRREAPDKIIIEEQETL